MATPTAIVGYLALFAALGFVFLLANLVVGWLVRPRNPSKEKLEIYECGEPAIGSSFVQFDLRFYVVALVFLVFDVEVAFLFPLATVAGKATQMADASLEVAVAGAEGETVLSPDASKLYTELGFVNPTAPNSESVAAATEAIRAEARVLARGAFWTIAVFFIILLIGFAYEWKSGAFDWVRVLQMERREQLERPPPAEMIEQPVSSA